jgi:hypothetical protein
MKRYAVRIVPLWALLLGATALAQAPISEVDTHIATARRGRTGLPRGVSSTSASRRRTGGGAGTWQYRTQRGASRRRTRPQLRTARAGAHPIRCSTISTGSAPTLVWALRSAGIILIDTNFAWATQPEIVDGMTPAKRYQIRHHQPRSWRPRPGRGGTANRYGAKVVMGSLTGTHSAAASYRRRRRAQRDIAVGAEGTKITGRHHE